MRKKAGSTAERRVLQRGPTPSPASKQTASADLVCKGQSVRTPRSDARIPFRRRGRPEFLCERLSCDHEGPTPSLRTNHKNSTAMGTIRRRKTKRLTAASALWLAFWLAGAVACFIGACLGPPGLLLACFICVLVFLESLYTDEITGEEGQPWDTGC